MEKCEIAIWTRSEGKLTRYRASGTGERTSDGIRLDYFQEGDPVRLEADNDSLVVTRSGGMCFTLSCKREKETALLLRLGEEEGGVPVFTHRYELNLSDEPGVRLDYEVRYPGRFQKISMKIKVKIISEEK